ncbi:MAG: hypothetical protein KDC84_01215 [Crocinitomicaceae bacterium]|nr:hypothetical protein [Crocinitomicaceae bacterium]
MIEGNFEKIKDVIQDSNLNFLIGSGASVPFFDTLGNIENWLTDLVEYAGANEDVKKYVKASIYKNYFDVAMGTNSVIRDYSDLKHEYAADNSTPDNRLQNVSLAYYKFLSSINEIVYERRSNTVTKQVNLFTTNIDVFLEKTIEEIGGQFNDGFHGIFNQRFSLSNFKKSYFQKSQHYDNVSELPVFNLLKVHGSVTWKKNGQNIEFDNLELVEEVKNTIGALTFLDIKGLNDAKWASDNRDLTIKEICDTVNPAAIPNCDVFIDAYEKLQIVNPTKEKFKDTTFNKNYYEMLRLYSNELEKEATSLFVIGFSMADEHIREITIRAIKSNPTLFVYICSFMPEADNDILANFKKDDFDFEKHKNIRLIHPEENFDLRMINEKLFGKVIELMKTKDKK